MLIKNKLATKLATWLAVTSVLLIAIVASSSAYAISIPGITDSSLPQFKNTVKLTGNKGNWTAKSKNETRHSPSMTARLSGTVRVSSLISVPLSIKIPVFLTAAACQSRAPSRASRYLTR